jgi:hypothetical protein
MSSNDINDIYLVGFSMGGGEWLGLKKFMKLK